MITILIGKSASGKDAILRTFKHNFGFTPIISTTSRPIRKKEVDGVDYIFVSAQTFKYMIDIGCFIEYRSYNTLVNGEPDVWYYGVQTFELEPDKNYIVILDVEGAREFIKYFGKENIRVVYIHADDDVRKSRAEKRGSFDETEWIRRLNDDAVKFSSDVCSDIVDLRIDNNGGLSLDDITYEIYKFISGDSAI